MEMIVAYSEVAREISNNQKTSIRRIVSRDEVQRWDLKDTTAPDLNCNAKHTNNKRFEALHSAFEVF
jgi:hypothetical protein